MSTDTVNAIVAAAAVGALLVVALAALIAAIALWRVSRDVRRVSRSLDGVTVALSNDLPQTLKELRQTAANLNRVSDELGPRLMRIDALLDDGEATVQSLRATAETAEDIVRGPAAAMDRAKRAAGAAGRAFASGADRLRRGVQSRAGMGRDDDAEDAEPTVPKLLGTGDHADPADAAGLTDQAHAAGQAADKAIEKVGD